MILNVFLLEDLIDKRCTKTYFGGKKVFSCKIDINQKDRCAHRALVHFTKLLDRNVKCTEMFNIDEEKIKPSKI